MHAHRGLPARPRPRAVVHDRRAAAGLRPREQPRPVAGRVLLVDPVVRGHAIVHTAGQRVAGAAVVRLRRPVRGRRAVRAVTGARDQQQVRRPSPLVAGRHLPDHVPHNVRPLIARRPRDTPLLNGPDANNSLIVKKKKKKTKTKNILYFTYGRRA